MNFKEYLNRIDEDHFKTGQEVKIKNAKSYDALAKVDKDGSVKGTVKRSNGKIKGEEYYAVSVGTGSYNVKASDIEPC